ncbi:MAG TPA: right-handed parallel beta-helix repeat-containing protein [Candidatus Paceibacterota bacterium]|nr:right-handed parallel beta-helix repeat-containing protein [Verrucomicrobiota bacterium]HRY50289.1 right-handed parallel beta-helix repeat-containing protein [Candidatus Paceibacterota bacterium]
MKSRKSGCHNRKFRPVYLNILGILAICVLGGCMSASQNPDPAAIGARVYHLSPGGSDAWSGKRALPDRQRTDGPFATWERARDAIRELKQKQGGQLPQPVRVVVHGGTYYLKQPIVFTPEDSGSIGAPVEFVAAPGESPVLSGGRRITGWQKTTLNGHAVWVARIPEQPQGGSVIRELWVNGERRTRARHPNRGYLAVAEVPDAKADVPWSQGQARFAYKAGEWPSAATIDQAEVRVMNRWVESHLPVAGVDETARRVTFRKNSVFKLDPGDLYYIENAAEFLDLPGEWWCDSRDSKIYYFPLPGEDPRQTVIVAPVQSQLIRFAGRPEAHQFIDHLCFRGLTFAHTEWHFPSGFDTGKDKVEIWPPPKAEVGGFAQAAIGVPGAVRAEGMRNAVFENCSFLHLGSYGLELGRGCQQNRVQACEFADLGAGGIKIGETAIRQTPAEIAWGNEISDCHIHDGGRLYHSAIGIWIGQSPSNKLRHNHIHDFYYTGISIGWTWGYDRALATNNLVEFNHVHHIGVLSNGDGPILSDMAGIYTLGLHSGTVIRNNLWHDTAGLRYGGWGIYFDEGTTGILAENNLVYRTTHGGFHQHYGKNNTVRNNIFVDAEKHQIQRSRAESHLSFTFEQNIVFWNRGKLLDGQFQDKQFLMRRNLYWHSEGQDIRFGQDSLADWQKKGHEEGSLVADPLFANPAAGDFRLKPGSPAAQIGFQPFDLGNVGPRVKTIGAFR